MYQNVFYDKGTKIAHIWDDEKGHIKFPFKPYAYRKAINGEYTSLFGDKLEKITYFDRDDPTLFESDVAETTRILIDTYAESDAVSSGHNILFFDIEVEMDSGAPDTEKAENEITSIATYYSNTKLYSVFVLDKDNSLLKENINMDNVTVVPCKTESELLVNFFNEYEKNKPTILTGWNCIDENEWVYTKNGLVQLKDIQLGVDTISHGKILNVWDSEKPANRLTLQNGKELLISDEHRIPVVHKEKNKYKYPSTLLNTLEDKTVGDIKEMLKTHDVYCKIPVQRNNIDTKSSGISDILQLLGFIYTDGTFSKQKNNNRITITNTSIEVMMLYKNIINNCELSVNSVEIVELKKRSENHSQEWRIRFSPSQKFKPYLNFIYDESKNKKLNLTKLSSVSEKEFSCFVSGLIDGDGAVPSGRRGVSICQSPKQSKADLYDLFSYFGIISNIVKNGIYIPAKNINRWLFDALNVSHVARKSKLLDLKFHSDKNSPRKSLSDFITESHRIIKIKSIETLGDIIKMKDIQTEHHYFTIGSIDVHNCDFFDVPYIFNRTKNVLGKKKALKLSPIGEHFYSPYRSRYFFGGVSILDYLSVYKKFTYTQLPSYSLDSVSKKELSRGKVEYEGNLDELKKKDIKKFIEYNITDVELVVALDQKLQFIDLVQGICHVGHVPYEDYIYSSKYLEGAVLTYLRRNNIVAPNKPADRQERMAQVRASGDEKFIGAYVKDPIVGKYEWIYDLDLTSLYPSIIMSLNISPETKIGKIDNWDVEDYLKGIEKTYFVQGEQISKEQIELFFKQYNYSVASNGVLYDTEKKGVIPSILDEWFDKRVEYKDEMKKYGKSGDTDKYNFYKKRQLVQKILLNSLYGVLGLPAFRFYDIDNAEAVTLTGQTVIKKTADVLNNKYNKELNTKKIDYNIYIDTDSCFFSALPLVKHRFPDIDTNDDKLMTEKIYDIANESQQFINGFYDIFAKRFFNIDKHRFEIKQEMIAKSGLWTAKKRYAQWIIADNGVSVDKLDVKGLDVIRSSFPKAFQKFMSNLLISILKGLSKDEIDNLILDMKKNVRNIDITDIAKNSSVNNLMKYQGAIDISAINSFAKGTPAHVKAAIVYNRLLEHYKCPYKYLPFRDGDKLKWIYLKDNPYNVDVIAFRGENDPKEIKKFIAQYADPDYMYEKELGNKIQDFYIALKWKLPTNNKNIINEFFEI